MDDKLGVPTPISADEAICFLCHCRITVQSMSIVTDCFLIEKKHIFFEILKEIHIIPKTMEQNITIHNSSMYLEHRVRACNVLVWVPDMFMD